MVRGAANKKVSPMFSSPGAAYAAVEAVASVSVVALSMMMILHIIVM
jgi:hypothetical protein